MRLSSASASPAERGAGGGPGRRRIVVTASAEGLAEVGRHYAPIGEAFARRFAGYTDNELRAVLKFMGDGREVADAEIDRIRGGGPRTPHARTDPLPRPRSPSYGSRFHARDLQPPDFGGGPRPQARVNRPALAAENQFGRRGRFIILLT